MIEILQYCTSGFWTFIGCAMIIGSFLYYGVNGLVQINARVYRMIMVLFRGWPPNHLDADGDWKPEPKEEAP